MIVILGFPNKGRWKKRISGNTTRGRAAQQATTVPPMAGQDFAQQATALNRAERTISELALQHASSAAVQAYAWQMIEDHQQAAADLAAIRPDEGVHHPSRMNRLATTCLVFLSYQYAGMFTFGA